MLSPKRDTSPSMHNQNLREKNDSKGKWYNKTKRLSQVNLKKQWSAVSNQVTSLKRHRTRNSCAASISVQEESSNGKSSNESGRTLDSTDPDYIRIPKVEYEEIKNRVLAIEKRISFELDSVDTNVKVHKLEENPLEKVQDEYEKTLNHVEQLSPTTDHLARRLSKELKIRKNPDNKIIRSPSARKIGSLRRKSKEVERQNAVVRRQSWHVSTLDVIPKVNLKRGRPNTVQSGLKTPPVKEQKDVQRKGVQSSSVVVNSPVTRSKSLTKTEKWACAEGFFNKLQTPPNTTTNLENCRASIVRLRSQNVGMVLAKAKLFDGILDSDNSTSTSSDTKNSLKCKTNNKIGTTRSADRQISRIRTLKADERKMVRNSLSPRKKSVPRHRLQLVKIASVSDVDSNDGKENLTNNVPDLIKSSPVCCNTPQNVPYIKKALSVRSPKRLHRTPIKLDSKRTPLKITTKPTITDC